MAPSQIAPENVRQALSTVRDPELDRSLTELGFVQDIHIRGPRVEVSLRLPTYFCAANFAFLMASDAREAVARLTGVEEVEIEIEDHYASEEINSGLDQKQGFDSIFNGESDGTGLEDLRSLFRRKAFLARQHDLCDMLLGRGTTQEELSLLTLDRLPPGEETRAYLERRAELGLECSPTSPFLVTAKGDPVPPQNLTPYLRLIRTVAVSLEGNAGFCRGLLATRYGKENL